MRAFRNSFFIFASIILSLPVLIFAQDGRSYFYESISHKFTVNEDTTVNVEETQIYNFSGEYHKGWRTIPLNKVTDITDVSVLDGETLKPLQYTSRSLDKTDPQSWGHYTYRKNNGQIEIEWYYNARDEKRAWILKYKLIGALSFLKNKDELYWNLFTDYDVPVDFVSATVSIPGNTYNPSDLSSYIYRTNVGLDGSGGRTEISDNNTFHFFTEAVLPREDVTIAAGWPKGIIDRGAFWLSLVKIFLPFILSVLMGIVTIATMIIYWYFTEKHGKGRGVIVPQYEPPRTPTGERIPPAMAELLVKEKLSPKAWAATVIDLAVRGYVKVTEVEISWWSQLGKLIIPSVFFIIIIFATIGGFDGFWPFTFIIFVLILFWKGKNILSAKDYEVEKVKDFENAADLHDYEKKFLETLLLAGGRFSTKEMKNDPKWSREIYVRIKKVEELLYKETDKDTNAYEKPVSKDRYVVSGIIGALAVGYFLAGFFGYPLFGFQLAMLIVVAVVCVVVLFLFIKFEARLSAEGAILREDWLGFKMYLDKAEKYRLQNLGPNLFEKYLPYAIIFGVEKKWGKAFEGISIPPPNWYHGTVVMSGGSLGGAAGFSASAFSASFASSFSSAFSSSGAGGSASGGGGGAGGGGGGGGGGAS